MDRYIQPDKILAFLKEENGQGLTEYGLVLGVISIAVIGFIATLRENIVTMFTNAVKILSSEAQ